MQRGREGKSDFFGSEDPFGGVGRFGSHRSMMPNLFGRRDPFDDPFFTRPFGSMFGSSMFGAGGPSGTNPRTEAAREPVIEELNSDDEVDGEGGKDKTTGDKNNDPKLYSGASTEPSVEHPDDDEETEAKHVKDITNRNRVEETRPKSQSYSFCKVTYGGINGTYRTSSINRRMGSDGVMVEERKDADMTTGQAEHRVSKAIHDKGHSVTRKLNPDGKVDTLQTLHNLREDELAGFEETWKGNANKHLPGWTEERSNLRNSGGAGSSGRARLPFPSLENADTARRRDYGARTNSSGGRAKNVVNIPID